MADATGAPCRQAISPPGGRLSLTLGSHAHSGTCGGSGAEAYATLELVEISDVFVSTHNSLGLDTVLYLRQATCDGAEVACNDDANGLTTSTLSVSGLQPGTYHLFVDTEAPSTVGVDVDVDVYVTPAGSPGDRCGAPALIPFGATTLTGTTCGMSSDYLPASTGACSDENAGAGPDVVFYFFVPTPRTVLFNGCAGSGYDQTFYVRSVCTSPTSQLGCNDDGCSGLLTCSANTGLRSSLSLTLQPGLYYFFVDGYVDSANTCSCGAFNIGLNGL